MAVTVEYTFTFEQTTELAIGHFAEYKSEQQTLDKIDSVLERFEEKVRIDPYIYSRSQSLLEIGITEVREANIDGMRLLYEVEERGDDRVVTGLVLLSLKQHVETQLVNYCLIYK